MIDRMEQVAKVHQLYARCPKCKHGTPCTSLTMWTSELVKCEECGLIFKCVVAYIKTISFNNSEW